jgi:hypothetical protein
VFRVGTPSREHGPLRGPLVPNAPCPLDEGSNRRVNYLSPIRQKKPIMTERPDAAFHEKKDKNKKTTNYGGGQKLKMKKALKYKKPITRGSKKK